MRIGVFGGTFDPVHMGHLILAEMAREQAALDEVWFVPSARPPHKSARIISPFERRLDMLQLAISSQPLFRVDECEKDRPGPSFTADTLHNFSVLYPDHEWFLLVGADCLPDLAKWHDPARILALATLVVARRPGWPVWGEDRLAAEVGIKEHQQIAILPIDSPDIGISSSAIRDRVRNQKSILFMVPHAVDVYIRDKRLYQ